LDRALLRQHKKNSATSAFKANFIGCLFHEIHSFSFDNSLSMHIYLILVVDKKPF